MFRCSKCGAKHMRFRGKFSIYPASYCAACHAEYMRAQRQNVSRETIAMQQKDNVTLFPRWKQNATAAEFLTEFAQLAAKMPEKFDRVCVLYFEDNSNKLVANYRFHNANTLQGIGMLDVAGKQLFHDTLRVKE